MWLGMSMALGRRILTVLVRYAIFGIGLFLVHTKTGLVILKKIVLPAVELNEYADKKGSFPNFLAFAVTLRTEQMSTLWESS